LPRAAAPDAAHDVVLVACMGIDQVVAIDASERPLVESIGTRFKVPAGPVAIAIDAASGDAWVWSMFERVLSRIRLGDVYRGGDAGTRNVAEAMLVGVPARAQLDAEWARGRVLFHAPVAFDGRACASCHPDARNDGITWGSPKGPLQTPFLVGRLADGAPYGWVGESTTVEAHLQKTLDRLQARALPEADMRAVARYAAGAKSFLSTRTRTPLEERGREIFESSETGCVLCHQDGGRKGDGGRHDVGTGGAYDTPSLRYIGASPPYMHDGRYTTLREVLTGTNGKMGTTKNLSEADVAALIAYLRSI
jgi:mono/diheme cytochrome c family protein